MTSQSSADQRSVVFRQEHDRLLAGVEQIRAAALELPARSIGDRAVVIGLVLVFLREELAGHAEAEEKFFYPELAGVLGNPRALAPMTYDHQMIAKWTDALAQTDLTDTILLQELLFGLHAVIRLHLWKEEEIYFPLLDAPRAEPKAPARRG
jgi:iron-sulfur cluster repair protein YtfE (RIC family)